MYKVYINFMNTTVINIKTDLKVKREAQKIAADLGLTLSGTINGFLKQFIRNKAVFFTLQEGIPSDYLAESLKESTKERNNKNYHSFKGNKEATAFIKKK